MRCVGREPLLHFLVFFVIFVWCELHSSLPCTGAPRQAGKPSRNELNQVDSWVWPPPGFASDPPDNVIYNFGASLAVPTHAKKITMSGVQSKNRDKWWWVLRIISISVTSRSASPSLILDYISISFQHGGAEGQGLNADFDFLDIYFSAAIEIYEFIKGIELGNLNFIKDEN